VATKKKKAQRRDWRMILFLALSLLIVLSMALAFVLPAAN
jgi:nitrate reductase NapE component